MQSFLQRRLAAIAVLAVAAYGVGPAVHLALLTHRAAPESPTGWLEAAPCSLEHETAPMPAVAPPCPEEHETHECTLLALLQSASPSSAPSGVAAIVETSAPAPIVTELIAPLARYRIAPKTSPPSA